MPSGIYERESFEKRFLSKVNKTDGCWIWMAHRNSYGYGRFYFKGKLHQATHISWLIKYGSVFPKEFFCCHRCDNPPCVNPSHLFAGTMKDNMRDSIKKGRFVFNGSLKLSACRLKGHPYEDNVFIHKNGKRRCLKCYVAYKEKLRNRYRLYGRGYGRKLMEGKC